MITQGKEVDTDGAPGTISQRRDDVTARQLPDLTSGVRL